MKPFDHNKFVGYVCEVTPQYVRLQIPSAKLLRTFYFNGEIFSGGSVGSFVVIEGQEYGFLGRVFELNLPQGERTEITDKSPSFDVTTLARGKSSTIRYSGKQNLFQSSDYSYYLLKEEPSYYKELSVVGGTVSAGKIVGEAKEIPNLYVTIAAGEAHHDFSPQITLYIDDPKNAGKVTKLTFSDEAEKAEKITESGSEAQPLSALKAIIATSSEGKSYGLTTLSNFFWGKSQIGFKAPKDKDYYPQHALVGKEVTSLTFITEKGLYVAKNIKVGTVATDAETKLMTFTENSGDEAKFVIPNLQGK